METAETETSLYVQNLAFHMASYGAVLFVKGG